MSIEQKLKEENDRLKAALQQWKGNHSIVIEDRDTLLLALVKLKDENDRLRTAGDAMHEELANFAMTWPLREAWNAAKEGNPSV
jgi:hypothetical protein